MKIGFIGLGIMGRPAALNLLRAGYALSVYARRAASLPPLLAGGAKSFSTPKLLAEQCELIITNVSDTADVEEVVLGKDGVIFGLKSGGIVLDMSTISPSAARAVAKTLAAKNIAFLDAPVSGGEAGAIAATLTFMVGGDARALQKIKPVLQTMGKTVTRIGDSGAGQTAKACNQIIIGATLSAVAESFCLAKANGADFAKIRAALLGGFAQSKVMEIHAQRMIENNYAPGFRAGLHLKDINIALEDAQKNNVPLPSATLFWRRLKKLSDDGGGDLDSSAIAKIVAAEK